MSLIDEILNIGFDYNGEERAFVDSILYSGFDPTQFADHLLKLSGGKEQLKVDMKLFAMAIAVRGVKTAKMLNKSSESGVKALRPLFTKYKVQDSIPRTQKDVTLGRISALIPHLIAQCRAQGVCSTIGETGALPRSLAFPSAVGLIPRDGEGSELIEPFRKWNEDFSRVIQSKSGTDFISIAWNSSMIDDKKRREILKSLGVL
jgi:hypothetical protein